jgi:hypothetical protein
MSDIFQTDHLTDPDVLAEMTHDQLMLRVETLENLLEDAQAERREWDADVEKFDRDRQQVAYFRQLLAPLIQESISQPGSPVRIMDGFNRWVSEETSRTKKSGKPLHSLATREMLVSAADALRRIIGGTA